MSSKANTLFALLVGVAIGAVVTVVVGGALLGSAKPVTKQDPNAVVITLIGNPTTKELVRWTATSPRGDLVVDLTKTFLQPIPYQNGILVFGWQVAPKTTNDTE